MTARVEPARVGIIGVGSISGVYLENAGRFAEYDVVSVADVDTDRAAAAAEKYDVRAQSVADMLSADDVDTVANLTVPQAHHEVSRAALSAGKHVYSEKPLALTREEGAELLELADRTKVSIGVAPDTFLGAGLQTCRQLVDAGWIGDPVAGVAFMTGHGHESWHPAPDFFYRSGGGPLFDMGPYYLTALVSLLGPVAAVTASARASFPERTISSQPRSGQKIAVEVDTHVAGTLEFASGAIVTLVMSFDVWAAHLPALEIYGSTGSMSAPDPNRFGGPVAVWSAESKQWADVPVELPFAENARGLGLADLAASAPAHRASGRLGYHVLDVMWCLTDSAAAGRRVEVASATERPEPLGDAVAGWD